MNNSLKHPTDAVKVALILAGAAIVIAVLFIMHSSGVLVKGGWVFLLFGGLIAYNFWRRLRD